MKLLTKQLPDDHNIHFVSCKHTGSQLSSDSGWEEMCNVVNSEYEGCINNFVADSGDAIEAIMVDDKRFSHEKLTEPLPLEQMSAAIKERQAIKHYILYMLDGNHERTLWRFGNLTQIMAEGNDMIEGLGTIYGTYSCKLTVRGDDNKLMYKIFHTHGRKGISSTADDPIRRRTNMNLILKRHLKYKAGDCAVMIKAHTHKLLSCPPQNELYLVDDGRKISGKYTQWKQDLGFIHPDARWYGCAGSFLKLYGDGVSGYAELAEYDPVELGWLILIVRDRKIVDLRPYYIKI